MQKFVIASAPKFIIEIDGTEYVMSRPKLGVVMAFERAFQEAQATKTSAVKLIADYVVAAGLPREVVDNLDLDALQAVAEAMTPAKKN